MEKKKRNINKNNRDTKGTKKVTKIITKEQIDDYEKTLQQLKDLEIKQQNLEKEIETYFLDKFYEEYPSYKNDVRNFDVRIKDKTIQVTAEVNIIDEPDHYYDYIASMETINIKYIAQNKTIIKLTETYTDCKGTVSHKTFIQ